MNEIRHRKLVVRAIASKKRRFVLLKSKNVKLQYLFFVLCVCVCVWFGGIKHFGVEKTKK